MHFVVGVLRLKKRDDGLFQLCTGSAFVRSFTVRVCEGKYYERNRARKQDLGLGLFRDAKRSFVFLPPTKYHVHGPEQRNVSSNCSNVSSHIRDSSCFPMTVIASSPPVHAGF